VKVISLSTDTELREIYEKSELRTYDLENSCIEGRKAVSRTHHRIRHTGQPTQLRLVWFFERCTSNTIAERFSSLTVGDGDKYRWTRQMRQEKVRIVHPWLYHSIRRFCTIVCNRARTDKPIITVQRFADHVHLAHFYAWMIELGAILVRRTGITGHTKLWWWMQHAPVWLWNSRFLIRARSHVQTIGGER